MSLRLLSYTSKYQHAGLKIYHPSASVGSMGITYRTSNLSPQVEQINVPINEKEWVELHNIILDADDGFQHERKRKYILQDFADIIKKITDTFKASIWKTLKASPLVTIHELLWLKVDDVDGRVGHIEIMLIPAIEKNKLLQHRIEVVEKMFMQVNEDNHLLHHKLDALRILHKLD